MTFLAENHVTCRNLLVRMFHTSYYMVSAMEQVDKPSPEYRSWKWFFRFAARLTSHARPLAWRRVRMRHMFIAVLFLWNSCLLSEGELESTSSFLWKRRSAVFLCQISRPFQLWAKLFTFAALVNLKRLVTVWLELLKTQLLLYAYVPHTFNIKMFAFSNSLCIWLPQ